MLREIADIIGRGCRLRCPCCGYGRLFKSATRMHERCGACGERFEREPGQWLGAVCVNLGLTLGFTVTGYLLLRTFLPLTTSQQLAIWTASAALAPFAFHRLSRGLWTSFVFLGEGLYLQWPSR